MRGASAEPHGSRPGLRPRARLVCRRHVDLCRTSSAICPSPRV
ncbi:MULTISPECIES: putative leader peptide [unclassified Streptomyces]